MKQGPGGFMELGIEFNRRRWAQPRYVRLFAVDKCLSHARTNQEVAAIVGNTDEVARLARRITALEAARVRILGSDNPVVLALADQKESALSFSSLNEPEDDNAEWIEWPMTLH
jgi:hypothetical protein